MVFVILCFPAVVVPVQHFSNCAGTGDTSGAVNEYGQCVIANEIKNSLGVSLRELSARIINDVIKH